MDYFDNISSLEKTFSSRTLEKDDVLFRAGDTLGDAVVFLKDKKNSGTLTILRAKLKELAI